MNDWVDTQRFQENDKVQRFCLTLTGEARLLYETLGLIKCRLNRITKLIQVAVFKDRQY